MNKGFVFFRAGRIPFVIENCRMELFTDDSLLKDFMKEHNFKSNYILQGLYFLDGIQGKRATFLVERSKGSMCYLCCYIINTFAEKAEYDTIGFQSSFLDDIFRYKYNYINMIRDGINLAVEPQDVYKVPFSMDQKHYELSFRIGQNNHLGLLEDFDKKGEVLIRLKTDEIQECYDISIVLYRLAMFMTSHQKVPFKRIILYKNGWKVGEFYSQFVSEEADSGAYGFYYQFDVMKYVPKILNNIALDSGSKITHSIPLGHIGEFDSLFSPQRFIQQVMAFEYLFDKLEHKKAQDSKFSLKKELKYMFEKFPQLLSYPKLSSDEISEQIKEIRRRISHGYAYYYDFKNDSNTRYLIVLLDKLIRNMSLLWIGFSKQDISDFCVI